MSRTKSLLSRARAAKLNKGIHDNVVITKVDIEDRKRNGMPVKRMIFTTFAVVDPETRKKKSEVELAWWKLEHTSDYLFDNIRELAIQLHGILACYMDEEEAFTAMESVFEDYDFKSVEDIENNKWKKKDLEAFVEKFKQVFINAVDPFVGLQGPLIRAKITTDNKGENPNLPSYGKFTEPMTKEKTDLKFSNAEIRNHSKAGNVATKKTGGATSKLRGGL